MGSFSPYIWHSERAGTEAKLLSFSQGSEGDCEEGYLTKKLLPGNPLGGLGTFYHPRGPAKQSWLMPYLLCCSPALSQQPFQLNLARHVPAEQEGISANTEVCGEVRCTLCHLTRSLATHASRYRGQTHWQSPISAA